MLENTNEGGSGRMGGGRDRGDHSIKAQAYELSTHLYLPCKPSHSFAPEHIAFASSHSYEHMRLNHIRLDQHATPCAKSLILCTPN